MDDKEYKKLQRASYISGGLTLLGFFIVLSALGFSYMSISHMENKLDELSIEEKRLRNTIDHQKSLIAEYEWASSPKAITAQTKRVKLDGVFDGSDRQIFDFSIWLQVPVLLKDRVSKVEYYFDHPTMLKKLRESSEPSNGYSVSYRGWGCLTNVKITVYLDEEEHVIMFNQCSGEQREYN